MPAVPHLNQNTVGLFATYCNRGLFENSWLEIFTISNPQINADRLLCIAIPNLSMYVGVYKSVAVI